MNGVWKLAVRVWLEMAIPPVFGKEISDYKWPISQTQVSAILF